MVGRREQGASPSHYYILPSGVITRRRDWVGVSKNKPVQKNPSGRRSGRSSSGRGQTTCSARRPRSVLRTLLPTYLRLVTDVAGQYICTVQMVVTCAQTHTIQEGNRK